jgi:hypothetical protein
MPSLLNAARYLAKEHGFTPEYVDSLMFPDPVVLASQRDTFQALHILACAATGCDPVYVSVRRVTDWLGRKSKAANV